MTLSDPASLTLTLKSAQAMVSALSCEIEDARKQLAEVVETMEVCQTTLLTTQSQIDELTAGLGQVSTACEEIGSVALNIRIVALNAAVEAAHVGAAGAGFAVVASAVKGLAGQSADSARSIETTINKVNADAETVRTIQQQLRAQIATLESKTVRLSNAMASQEEVMQAVVRQLEGAASELATPTKQPSSAPRNHSLAPQKLAPSPASAPPEIAATADPIALDDYGLDPAD